MFYTDDIEQLALSKEESQHCIKVLRKKIGDLIQVIDGKGALVEAEITNTIHKQVHFSIVKNAFIEEVKPYLHLYIAPTKNISRMEWLLEKCTEIGIKSITPIICQRSERKVIKPERLIKVLVTATKQSQRAWLPHLFEQVSYKSAVEKLNEDNSSQKFVASYHIKQKNLEEWLKPEKDVHVFIGPEGDFTEEEKKLANNYNFAFVNLGKYRLRTETAGIVATHIFNLKNRTNRV